MDRTDVERAVKLAGLALPAEAAFEVTGAEPVLASPHFLATGAAAARLLTGLAAAELWWQRTGRRQQVVVDARHAAASLRSYQYARPAGTPEQSLESLAARSGAPPRLRITRIMAARDAFELEAAFIARRVCGGAVRSKEEWAAHPQGQVISGLPAVTVTKIGQAPPVTLPDGDRPLSGVRVLDLTRVLAGPTCAKTLAEHGADVLHVSAPHLEGGGPFEMETGIGKRQAALDLNDPDQAATLHDLIAGADVFSQGYRLGTLARRGFSPAQVAQARPGIVYVSENCYGHVGPWAGRPGWEQLGQAATGMSFREGQAAADRVPRLAPAAVNDYSTGFLAAYGVMTALSRRAAEGGSWHVQVSLCQTCMWYQRLGDDNDAGATDLGDIEPFTAVMDTSDFGTIRYLTPAVRMSETPPRWDLPPARVGAHEPTWLTR